MNLLHVRYAVEVARQGSLSRAAETLHTAQPNISRAIKDLEIDIGVVLFRRSKRGMALTPEGEDFIAHARSVLSRLDEMEGLYKRGVCPKKRFFLAAPDAAYMTEALTALAAEWGEEPYEIVYRVSGVRDTLRALEDGAISIGIIRYPADQDELVKESLAEKGVSFELVAEFSCGLLMHRDHPAAADVSLLRTAPSAYTELVVGDASECTECADQPAETGDTPAETGRRMTLPTQAACLDVLAQDTEAYMWSPPLPPELPERYGLVWQKPDGRTRIYKDVLVYREKHSLTQDERQFVTALCTARRRTMPT